MRKRIENIERVSANHRFWNLIEYANMREDLIFSWNSPNPSAAET